MFGILLKKQLYEICRSLFYNKKAGKNRSKAGTGAIIVLYVCLIVILFGGIFTALAIGLAAPLYAVNAGHLYFVVFALLGTAVGLFGGVFGTYSSLYLAKDNDLLLSLPIPSRIIVAVRLFGVYLTGAFYSALVFLPGEIVWQAVSGFDLRSLIGSTVMLIDVTVIVWVLSCLLGFVIAKISLKLKNRSTVAVIASLVFMGIYYFVYFKAQDLVADMATNAALYGEKIKGSAYILYIWGRSAGGNIAEMLLCLGVCVIFGIITLIILGNTFFDIAAAAPNNGKSAKAKGIKAAKENDIPSALLKKEFSRFAASANYMLNCGLGSLFILAAGVVLIVKGRDIYSALAVDGNTFAAVLAAVSVLLASMNDSAAPSISLESKTLWLLQSLPVSPWLIIKSKATLQFITTEAPMLVYCIGTALLPLPLAAKLSCIAISLIFPLLSALFNMFIGLKLPVLDWTNETVPVKQSGGVAIALFGGWGYGALLVGGYVGFSRIFGKMSIAVYFGIFAALTLLACALLRRWLKRRGTAIFAELAG